MKRLALLLLFCGCAGNWALIETRDGREEIGKIIAVGTYEYFYPAIDTVYTDPDTTIQDTIYISGDTVKWCAVETADFYKIYIGDSTKQFILNDVDPDPYPATVIDTIWTFRKFSFSEIVHGLAFVLPDTILPNGNNTLFYDWHKDCSWPLPTTCVISIVSVKRDRGWYVESDWSRPVFYRRVK